MPKTSRVAGSGTGSDPGDVGHQAAVVGHDLEELDAGFQDWNAHLADDGRLMPDIARV